MFSLFSPENLDSLINGQKAHFLSFDPQTPLKLVLILSRTLWNITALSGFNMTKPMSLKTSIFMFIVPKCHVSQQTHIYVHHSFGLCRTCDKKYVFDLVLSHGTSLNHIHERELDPI